MFCPDCKSIKLIHPEVKGDYGTKDTTQLYCISCKSLHNAGELRALYKAAPEMLEICRELVDALKPFRHQNCKTFSGFPEYALERGEAIIAKAEGRQDV